MSEYVNGNCPCKSTTCVRHGKCDECKAFHNNKGQLTKCQKKAEKNS